MRSIFLYIIGIITIIVLHSCTQRMICPAYQSAFMHDKDYKARHFSYFGEDSLPKGFEVSKDKFLVMEPMSYRKKIRSLNTIEMKDLYPEIEDALEFAGDDFMLAERDVVDSVQIDSLALHPGLIGPFNVDQENYLWYFRKVLVYPDRRAEMAALEEIKKESPDSVKSKKGFFSFFKNLFKKKEKKELDENGQPIEPGDEEPITQDEEPITQKEQPEKEKKGLFSFGKKKKEKEKPPIIPPEEPEPAIGDGDEDFIP